ncbi:MAG: hypothetical protein ACI9MC_003318 [Kiritimatiellia bacterium]|jgi:hypothetical protein
MDLEQLRPKLHRYCSRMVGSVVDGEDVVQDTLTVARVSDDHRALIQAYIARFNAQDWDGVCAITRADARIEVVGFGGGEGHDFMRTGYFRNYSRLPPWRLALAVVHGEEHVVHYRRVGETWRPLATQVLQVRGDMIVAIKDYVHVDYLLNDAQIGEVPA